VALESSDRRGAEACRWWGVTTQPRLLEPLNVLSLFAGIGGLDLGLERAGMHVVGQVEIDPFCQQVLAKHWPEVPRHDDVRTAVEWWYSTVRPRVDVLAGGFPCQDISTANTRKRRGLSGDKSGRWVDFAVVADAVRPTWIVVENSPNWPQWTPRVRSDLYGLGYATTALRLPAGHFGAWHQRPRVFVVAHADRQGEPLRAIHAEVARLRPIPRSRGHWRLPFAGPLRVADGLPARMDRLRALGNAVVPQVAEYVGRLIVAHAEAAAA